MVVVYVVIALVAGLVFGALLGRTPKPKPKRFGLAEAEAVASRLGGLDPAKATAVKVAVAVGGMEFGVVEDADALRASLTQGVEEWQGEIAEFQERVRVAQLQIVHAETKRNVVTALAANFK